MTPETPRVGIRVPQYGGTWDDIARTAQLLSSAGVDALWVNDHFQSPGRQKSDPTFDAFTTLGALAALTDRVRLGVAVMSASYRPPQVAAKMTTVLDVISGGRLILGLGTGSDRDEHRAYGIPFGTAAERTAGVRRTLAVMDAMWTFPDGATHDGMIEDAPNRPQLRRPPVWLAAHGPVLLRHAGRHADGIVAAWTSPSELGARLEIASSAAAEAGRPPLAIALYTFCLVGPTAAERQRLVAAQAARLGTTPVRLLRWLGTTGLVGTAAEVRDRLADYARIGVTDVILALPERVPDEAYAAVAEIRPVAAPPPRPVAHGVSPRANLVWMLVGRHLDAGRGGQAAAIDPDGSWTYDDLWTAARQTAGALGRDGVRPGDRVVVALRDGRAWIAAFLGIAWCGAVAVPVDPTSPSARIRMILDDCDPQRVIADPGLDVGDWPVIRSDALVGPPGPDVRGVHPEDLAYMIYSSGSTGRPKGVMHAHRDLATGIETYARQILELAPGQVCHSVAKLATSLGFGNGFFRVLGCGATAVLSPYRPNPRTVIELTERHGVDVLTAVPTFWGQMAEYLRRHPDPDALAHVRLLVSSGDGLPPGIATRLAGVVDAPLIEGLGCSECSNVVISTRPGDADPGALGRAVPGIDISLRDPDGLPVDDGVPGRLWIRSPSNTSGYWRRAEETRDLVVGEWIRMGDVLVRDNGIYRHVGRIDDLFKVDGRWVSPREVEHCLLENPHVRDAAVGGVADPAGLVGVTAWVVIDGDAPDTLPGELRRHVAHALGRHMAPRDVRILESLPRLPSGKLDRRALRDAAAGPA
jgi:fatty acid CoA ligase FadD22